jgi:hypothetical protein
LAAFLLQGFFPFIMLWTEIYPGGYAQISGCGRKKMSTERNTHQIKKASYKVFAMLVGLIFGMAMDNIPVGFILGLSIGVALVKHYR